MKVDLIPSLKNDTDQFDMGNFSSNWSTPVIGPNFNLPPGDLCQELLRFTMNPVSIFSDSWQNAMIATYA